jgi:crotonobetainyl-CoA:carnitine CoA-transferase CaiB-like acyl-CoA transferase
MGGGAFVPPLGDMGYKRLLSRTRGPYATRDGHLSLVVYTDAHWRAFSAMIGRPTLMEEDPRFKDMATRVAHSDEMGLFLAEHLASQTTAEWIPQLEAADIPVSPVNHIDDLFENDHLKAVGLFEEVDHPTEGRLKMARFPVRFERSPTTVRRLAPNLGEHTQQVLAELLPESTKETP